MGALEQRRPRGAQLGNDSARLKPASWAYWSAVLSAGAGADSTFSGSNGFVGEAPLGGSVDGSCLGARLVREGSFAEPSNPALEPAVAAHHS